MIEDRVADDLAAFVRDLGEPDALSLRTIAITEEQVHGLPQNPEKPGQFQAEALPPNALARIVREAVESEVDLDAVAEAQAEEEAEREAILDRAGAHGARLAVTDKWKCSRCGKLIKDDEDSMILYEADPRDWERMLAAGENPLDDPPQ